MNWKQILKHAIKLNLLSRGTKTKESNIKIAYGFPKKIINNDELDNLTLEELSIFDKEYLLIELISFSFFLFCFYLNLNHYLRKA